MAREGAKGARVQAPGSAIIQCDQHDVFESSTNNSAKARPVRMPWVEVMSFVPSCWLT